MSIVKNACRCWLWQCFFAALLAGCAPRVKIDVAVKPDWVEGSSQKFSTAQYFVGKGYALALDVAAMHARKNLFSTLSSLKHKIPAAALNKLVQQAEVVDAWQDTATKQHYALVVLERDAVKKQLRAQLSALDNKAREFIGRATTAGDPLAQIRATHEALATQQSRVDLVSALQALGDDVAAADDVWSTIEMQVHLKSLLSSIDVAPLVTGNRLLTSAVARGLDAAGYLSKREQPSYRLKVVLERSGMQWTQGWFAEKGTLSVELLDQQQQVISEAQWPLQAKARERVMLENELLAEVTNILRAQLTKTVLGLVVEKDQK